jgi:hypothetical protein
VVGFRRRVVGLRFVQSGYQGGAREVGFVRFGWAIFVIFVFLVRLTSFGVEACDSNLLFG